MSLNTKWGDNVKIYDHGTPTQKEYTAAIARFVTKYPSTSTIWLQDNKYMYGDGQTINEIDICGHNHHFICGRQDFLFNQFPQHTVTLNHYKDLRNNFGNVHAEYANSEFKMGIPTSTSLNPAHARGEDLLIVAGGPSSKGLDYKNLCSVEAHHVVEPTVWTMNNVMNNHSIWDQIAPRTTMMSLMDDVALTDELAAKLEAHNITVMQEISDLGPMRHEMMIRKFGYRNLSYFMTRYRSKLGIGARLLVLAALLRFRKVYFIGMDGYNINSATTHAFEENKNLPGWLQKLGPKVQEQQFVILWDYLLNTLPKMGYNTKYVDLAANHETSQYRFISQAENLGER